MKCKEVKPKRVKKVFSSSSQVYHLWANQSQDEARQGGNRTRAFFEGASAYSYGTHYEVGRIVKYKGIKVGVINNSGYSVTTGKHINEAWGALENLMPRVKSKNLNVRDGLVETQGEYVDRLMGLFSRRTFWNDSLGEDDYILYGLGEFNQTCRKLGHSELVLDIPAEFIELVNEHIKKRRAIQKVKDAEADIKRAEKQRLIEIENAKDIQAWIAGHGEFKYFMRNMRPMLLRVKENVVETSGGAEVPLKDALRFMNRLIKGEVKAGESVGEFTFDSLEDGMIKIGCHTIDLNEAKRALLPQASALTKVFQLVQGGKQ
jgi:hypothetical protein